MGARFIGQGLTLTFLCWLTALLVTLGVLGDCSSNQHACPSDHQRDIAILKIALGAAAINVSGLLILGLRASRR